MNYRTRVILAIVAITICSSQAKPSKTVSSVPGVKGSGSRAGKKSVSKKKRKPAAKKRPSKPSASVEDLFGGDDDDEYDLQSMVNSLDNSMGDDFYDMSYDSEDLDQGYNRARDSRDDGEQYGQDSEKGALYDAYNLLHSLAQVSLFALLSYLRFLNYIIFDTYNFRSIQ
jgi:hypothetical protein